MRFDDNYRETATLRDGSRVTLRLVRPDDKELLRRGFERLSPESRYRRFLSPKSVLSDAELAYLTEVDGTDHFAMGAVVVNAHGGEEGVAIGRFIRSKTDPCLAEVAVAVIDDWQCKGLGTLLLLRLAAAARERGIDRFGGHALASNEAIRDVLAQVPSVRLQEDADGLALEVDLPDGPFDALPERDDHAPARQLLGLVARGLLRLGAALEKLAGADAKTA